MEGINLRELIGKDADGYKCLVEAITDHDFCSEDPLTDKILKGAQGIGYAFWPMNGEWWRLVMTVEWEPGYACNYIETYRKWSKIKKPITEIKFVREFGKDEIFPKNNPLLVKKY